MSHTLSNFRDSAIRLSHGDTNLFVPSGWNGSLNLLGDVNVYGLTQTITTNVTPGTNTTGLCTIDVQMLTPGYSVTMTPAPGPLAIGSTFDWTVYDGSMQSLASGSQGVTDDLAETWFFSVNGANVNYYGVPQPWPGTTNYTTNAAAESLLGTYTADHALRGVEVDSSGLRLADFNREAEMAASGFCLALTIAFTTWIVRIVRGAGKLGTD